MPQLLNKEVWEQGNCCRQSQGRCAQGMAASPAPKPCRAQPSSQTLLCTQILAEHLHLGCLGAPAEQTCPKTPHRAAQKFPPALSSCHAQISATGWITWGERPEKRQGWNKWKQIFEFFRSSQNEPLLVHFFAHHSCFSLTFCLLRWDALFSARQDFRKSTVRGLLFLGLPLRAGVSQMFLLLLDGSGKGFCTNQPQISPEKFWLGVTLISTSGILCFQHSSSV